MNIYLRKVASEGINHHVEHCISVPASRVLFSSRCPTFRVSLLSSFVAIFGLQYIYLCWLKCGRAFCKESKKRIPVKMSSTELIKIRYHGIAIPGGFYTYV